MLDRHAGLAAAGRAALALATAATAFFIVGVTQRHAPAALPVVMRRLHRLAEDLASRA